MWPLHLVVATASAAAAPTLLPRTYTPLPAGSVTPKGWLQKQLNLQAEGLASHLPKFWNDIMASVWVGGNGDGGLHERAPYWLNGMVPLAYLVKNAADAERREHAAKSAAICTNGTDSMYSDLDNFIVKDAAACRDACIAREACTAFVVNDCNPSRVECWLKYGVSNVVQAPCRCLGMVPPPPPTPVDILNQTRTYLEYIMKQQTPDGWLGPQGDTGGDQYWGRMPILMALCQYAEAEPDKAERVKGVILKYLLEVSRRIKVTPFGDSWAGARWQDLELSIQWILDNNAAQGNEDQLWALSETIHTLGFDWESWFENLPTDAVHEANQHTHGVNNGQALKSSAVWYRHSRNSSLPGLSKSRMANLDKYHGQATGMFGCDEHLAGRMPSRGTELCTVVETMFSYEVMFAVHGDVAFADRAEKIAYNALPATWASPRGGDMWNHQYLQQVNEINAKHSEPHVWEFDGPDSNKYGLEPNFGCCTANFPQGWPKLANNLFFTTQDGGVAVGLYAPASAVFPKNIGGGGVQVSIDTTYPFDDKILVTVTNPGANALPLYLRIPGWTTAATLQVGSTFPISVTAGTMSKVTCPGKQVTTVTLDWRAKFRVERGYNNAASIHRGALLYALNIDGQYTATATYSFQSRDYEVLPKTAWNFALDLDPSQSLDSQISYAQPGYKAGSAPFNRTGVPSLAKASFRALPTWGEATNAAAAPPNSPACKSTSCGPSQAVTMVPYGCTDLRIAEFPLAAAN